MTLQGGETPGKETFYLKGGGAVTAKRIPGSFLRGEYWIGEGPNAPKGRYPSLKALKRAAQEAKDSKPKRKGWF